MLKIMGASASHPAHPDGKTMKALTFVKHGPMESSLELIGTQPVPVQGKGELLIKVRATSLNPIDKMRVEGGLKALRPETMTPSILGYDGAGIVEAVGEGVADVQVGAEVFFRWFPPPSQGTIAEFVAVPADQVVNKPVHVSFEEAASFPLVGLTTIQAMTRGGVKEGDKVFISGGAGGVGTFAIQYAKNVLKAGTVATTASPGEKTDLCKSLGADVVINYREEKFEEVLTEYDFAFDTSGESAKCAQILKKGKKVVTIAGTPSLDELTRIGVRPNFIVRTFLNMKRQKEAMDNAEAAGVEWSNLMLTQSKPDLQHLADNIAAGLIKPVVDNIWDLSDWQGAVKQSASGRAKGKCVIRVA